MNDSLIKSYYESLGQGKLVGKKCTKCQSVTFPPTTACGKCGSYELTSIVLSGKGTLLYLSHGMAPPPNPRFNDLAPYAYGHIKLEEGVFLQAIVTGMSIEPASLRSVFEAGPVKVVPNILEVGGLSVLAFKKA
jgi:hypothetical protein